MILDGDAIRKLQSLVVREKVSKDNIDLYKQLNLFPRDFGFGYTSWSDWLSFHGEPEHTGVTLTKEDVQHLRKAISYITEYAETRTDALTPTSKAVLKKVGLQPADLELSGTWD